MRRIPNIAFALLVSALILGLGCGDSSTGGGSAGDEPSETPDESSSSTAQVTCNGSKPIVGNFGPLVVTLDFPSGGIATDVDVELVIGHNRLHDLKASVTHVNSATTVALFDGISAGSSPCNGRNLDAIISNRSGSRDEIQDEACNPAADPAVDGTYRALGNMQNFTGIDPAGPWLLAIEDQRLQQAGSVEAFCVIAYFTGGDTRVCATALPDSIPDPPGFTLINEESFAVTDLDVILGIDHGDLGNLTATLSHDDGVTSVTRTLFDPIPSDAPPTACDGMDAVLDDSAGTGVAASCVSASVPAVSGSFQPQESLALGGGDFLGQDAEGEWVLSLVDPNTGIVGDLDEFCLSFNGGGRTYCSGEGPFPIPVGSTLADLSFASSRVISRVDVNLEISHPRLNDMVATLTHNGITTTLFSRIRLPAGFGGGPCAFPDLDGRISDVAGVFNPGRIQDQKCSPDTVPAVQFSSFPLEPMSTFNGEDAIGTWTLEIRDQVSGNTGSLEEFCITINPGTFGQLTSCSTAVGQLIPGREGSIQLEVLEPGVVADVDVGLRIQHDWLGDVSTGLSHTGLGVELFGEISSATGGPCFGDNMDVVFDDAAGSRITTGACFNFRDPAVSRRYQTSDTLFGLALFNGQDSDGSWVMKVADSELEVDGQVDEFCVVVDAE